MTDQRTLAVAAIKFKWQKDGDAKTYDYFIPAGLDLAPGDKVTVETKRGETTVEVVAIKAESDMAQKQILRRADPVEPAAADAAQPNEEWSF